MHVCEACGDCVNVEFENNFSEKNSKHKISRVLVEIRQRNETEHEGSLHTLIAPKRRREKIEFEKRSEEKVTKKDAKQMSIRERRRVAVTRQCTAW